jgi:hypothetical protein
MDDLEVQVVTPKPKSNQDMPEWALKVEPYIDWLDSKLRWRTWFIIGFVVLVAVAGTPHILVTYKCYGNCRHQHAQEFDCNYLGIWGWQTAEPDRQTRKCARFLLM